jgi:ferredoxin
MATDVKADVFTVRVGDRSTFPCAADQPVLAAMERQGLKPARATRPIRVGCRGGGCGICKVRVVSGRYHCGKMSRAKLTAAEEAEGHVLACKLFPEGDLEIEVEA